jgi:methionyl-tRNA synthetase
MMSVDVRDQINKHAEREGLTPSGFLAQAAKKIMALYRNHGTNCDSYLRRSPQRRH